MKTEIPNRWAAAVAVLSGAAFLTEGVLYQAGQETLQNILLAIAYPLAAVSLVGFNALQRPEYGMAGRLGSYVVPLGWMTAFVGMLSGVEAAHGIGFLVALVGYLLYGVGTLRARVLPRWCGVALVVAAPASLLAGGYTTIVLGLLWIPLGAAVWTRGSGQPQGTRAVMA